MGPPDTSDALRALEAIEVEKAGSLHPINILLG
jgi:hypothetical protein